MKILFEHSGQLPVTKYGGTERFLFWLMRELVRTKHEVYLIGNAQSNVNDYGIKLIPRNDTDGASWHSQIPKGIDLVHLFSTPPADLDVPVVVTIEGNGRPNEVFHKNTVFLSKKHAENHESESFIYNGIDLSEYPFVKRSRNWKDFLFLAKARWKVKNLKDCIIATRKAKKRLNVAGGRGLPFAGTRFYGMVDNKKKLELFEKTDALLFPVRWHEPFGIAVTEALACGLPAIGSKYGSLPEIINVDVGYLCKDIHELIEIITKNSFSFNSKTIRDYVESKFRIDLITKKYLGLYERVLSGQSLNPTPPKTKEGFISEELLDF